MSEALCQCGHAQNMHTEFMPQNGCRGILFEGHLGTTISCPCTTYTPPPTREPIRLTDDECAAMELALGFVRTSERPRVLADVIVAVESILTARLAGGPTLADARTPESEDTE